MPGYFICKHCGNRIKKNPRLVAKNHVSRPERINGKGKSLKKILFTAKNDLVRRPNGEKVIMLISIKRYIVRVIRIM